MGISEEVGKLSLLVELHLDRCNVIRPGELLGALKGNSMRSLRLSDCTVVVEGAQELLDLEATLRGLVGLRSLVLRRVGMDRPSYIAVKNAASDLSELRTLHLSASTTNYVAFPFGMPFGMHGMHGMPGIDVGRLSKLRHLTLPFYEITSRRRGAWRYWRLPHCCPFSERST